VDTIARLNASWSNDPRGKGRWSGRWRGRLSAPFTGDVLLTVESRGGLQLDLDGRRVIDNQSSPPVLAATMTMVKGREYPIVVTFDRGRGGEFRVYWQWTGQNRELVPQASVTWGGEEEKAIALIRRWMSEHASQEAPQLLGFGKENG